MTRVVTALYNHSEDATEVIAALQQAGFAEAQVECLEPDPESRHFVWRLHDGADQTDVLDRAAAIDRLDRVGLPEDDIEEYLTEIKHGRSLVAVRAEEEISGRARQVMNRFPLAQSHERTTLEPGPRTYPYSESGNQARRQVRSPDPDYPTTDIIEVGDESEPIDSPDISKRSPGTEAGGPEDEIEIEEVAAQEDEIEIEEVAAEGTTRTDSEDRDAIGELSGRVAEQRYKLYRPRFYRHFVRHYAAITDHDFDVYARAYRFGMALATSPAHRHQRWEDVAERARTQWERKMNRPWRHFREAVRFAWYLMRGQEEKYGRRP